MPLSAYARNKLMDDLFAQGAFVSLHSSDPGLKGDGEVSGSSYARQPAANAFVAAANGEKKSNMALVFEDLPETQVTHIGVWDSAKGGNFLWSAELLATRKIYEGDSIKLGAGHIILGLT